MKSSTLILAIAAVALIGYTRIGNKSHERASDTRTTAAQALSYPVGGSPSTAAETETEPVAEPIGEPTPVSSRVRRLELPAPLHKTPERIISRAGYTLSFNRLHNNPNWVAWELTAAETEGTARRSDEFLPDPLVPEPHRVTTEDNRDSGYDRGHMAPAADMKWSVEAMRECFYMSNICPQNHALNSGSWATLEKACRRWTKREGSVYIVCGPVYNSGRKTKTIGREHTVTVPDGFFKCVLSTRTGAEKAIGFYYANRRGKQPMTATALSVDSVEALTGMDFFVNLDDRLEKRVEASYSLKSWQ